MKKDKIVQREGKKESLTDRVKETAKNESEERKVGGKDSAMWKRKVIPLFFSTLLSPSLPP